MNSAAKNQIQVSRFYFIYKLTIIILVVIFELFLSIFYKTLRFLFFYEEYNILYSVEKKWNSTLDKYCATYKTTVDPQFRDVISFVYSYKRKTNKKLTKGTLIHYIIKVAPEFTQLSAFKCFFINIGRKNMIWLVISFAFNIIKSIYIGNFFK